MEGTCGGDVGQRIARGNMWSAQARIVRMRMNLASGVWMDGHAGRRECVEGGGSLATE